MSQQYFESSPRAHSRPGSIDVVLADLHLRLATDSGVFSADRLDPGTRVLLESVPAPPATGELLDVGCGYGPIALTMATRAPGATVWAVDVNERAIGLCTRNADAAGLTNVHACLPGQVPATTRFAAIWSNPPVRVGKPALHELLTGWLSRLAADGTAYLVVHKHLGSDSLQGWLERQGWPARRRASRSGYRVLEIGTRP